VGILQRLAIICVSAFALSGCGGGCFSCLIMGDSNGPEEPSSIPADAPPRMSERGSTAGPAQDTSCRNLANQRAEDEAGMNFNPASWQQVIDRTYADCMAAMQRYGTAR
jgi:hypothetical protein